MVRRVSPVPVERARRRPLVLLAGLSWFVLAGIGAGLVFSALWPARLSEVGPWWVLTSWFAFMFETFALHGALIVLVVGVFAALTRRWKMALVALVLAGWGAYPTVEMRLRQMSRESWATTEGGRLRVLTMNLLYGRADADAVMRVIDRERPDVVVFQEWTAAAEAALLTRMRAIYPHELLSARDDAFGQASFSNTPMLESRAFVLPSFKQPQHTFVVEHGGKAVRLVNVHVLPPVSMEYFREQRLETAALAEYARGRIAAGERLVLAGDFNAIWASAHGRAVREAGLKDAQYEAGTGVGGTWPADSAGLRIWPRVTLDHVLSSDRVKPNRCRVLESIGSDHAPVVAEFVVWE